MPLRRRNRSKGKVQTTLSTKSTKLKGSDKKRRIEREKKKETITGLAIVLVIVVVLAGAGWYFISPSLSSQGSSNTRMTNTSPTTGTQDPTLTTCIDDANLAMHIHVKLSIVINGQPVPIPANVGVSLTCTRPVHTHDESGEIHVESPVIYPYTLKDFFLVWGQPFDNAQIMEYKIDSAHTIRMTVNGAPNTQFQNYVLRDGDQIQITYGPF